MWNTGYILRCLIGSGVGLALLKCLGALEALWRPWYTHLFTLVRVHLWCFHAKWEETIWVSLKGKNHLKLAVETLNWAHTGPGIMPVSPARTENLIIHKHRVEYSGESSQVVGKINPIQILFWYCPTNLGSQKIKLNEITWLYITTNIYRNTNMKPSPDKTKFPYWVCD